MIYNQDIMEWCKSYKGEKFHAILCDPPYELGFLGKEWDKSGIAFNPETWKALKEHLHDGGFGMAFASSRGWHRMAVAIEDAGFIIHPTIFGWAFGCLSEDTEILTKEGWKYHRDILTGNMVACYYVNNEEINFYPIQEVFKYNYNDTAYHIQSDKTDQIVSRNHRVIIERGGKKIFKLAEALERQENIPVLENVSFLQEATNGQECGRIPQKKPLFTKVCGRNISAKEIRTKDRQKERYNKLLTETQTTWERNKLPSLWQKILQTTDCVEKNQTTSLFSKMQWLFQGAGLEKTCTQGKRELETRKRKSSQRKNDWQNKSFLERWGNLFQKTWELLANKICQVSERVFENGTQRWVCYGTQAIGSATTRQTTYTNGSGASYQSQPTRQQIGKSDVIFKQYSTQKLRGNRHITTTLATITPVHYEGIVWCVKVSTGAFVARRNGKIFVTGNSGFPKATRIDHQVEALIKLGKTNPQAMRQIRMGNDYKPTGQKDYKLGRKFSNEIENDDHNPELSDEAKRWAGHRYGLQAIKPALEILIVFSKPLTIEPKYYKLIETTILLETILCINLPVQVAQKNINHLHQHLKVVVGNFVLGNAERREWLKNAMFVENLFGLNRANLTLHDFVQGDAPTLEELNNVAKITTSGQAECLLIKDIDISEKMESILENIVLLWKNIWGESCLYENISTIEMETNLIIELTTLNYLLLKTIQENMHQKEHIGQMLNVRFVEEYLANVLTKLHSQRIITATENVIGKPAKLGLDPRLKAHIDCIIVFQKPYKGKPIQNIMETGAGALNIDGCRLTPDNVNQPIRKRKASSEFGQNSNWNDHNNINTEYDPNQGRWPANFIILDDQAKEALDRQSGVLKSGDNCIRTKSGEGYHGNIGKAGDIQISYGDSGGASRFFFNVQNQIDEVDPVYYCAKSSQTERNNGLDKIVLVDIIQMWKENNTIKEEKLVRLLVAMEQSQIKVIVGYGIQNKSVIEWSIELFGNNLMERYRKDFTSIILTGIPSITPLKIYNWLVFLLTKEYTGDVSLEKTNGGNLAENAENLKELIITINEKTASRLGVKSAVSETQLKINVKEGRSEHPTHKPLSLTKYLATLLLPPEGYHRRILIPFAGVGSEMIGAMQAGWDEIIGVELSEEYIPIAEARLKYWKNKKEHKVQKMGKDDQQLEMQMELL